MSAKIIDGRATALAIRNDLKEEISALSTTRAPKLVFILVGDNPASISYVKGKQKACNDVGITSHIERFDKNETNDKIASYISSLNMDSNVDGILLQLPLPDGFDQETLLNTISPDKDVDGLTALNFGRFFKNDVNNPFFTPCTPLGCLKLITDHHGDDLSGLTACVIGRSNLIGKPVAHLLRNANATVIHCHSHTKDIASFTNLADIVVVATGNAKMVQSDWIKEGATIIDVGVNKVGEKDGKAVLVGDADFRALKNKAGAITPVPKGVGPMTIAMLLHNCVKAYKTHIDQ